MTGGSQGQIVFGGPRHVYCICYRYILIWKWVKKEERNDLVWQNISMLVLTEHFIIIMI